MASQLLRFADEEVCAATPHEQVEKSDCYSPEGGTFAQSLRMVVGDSVYLCRLAEALVKLRRLRDRQFDAELFADPAWDMLLDLFIQRCKGRKVAVSSACQASQVPPTTALRWLDILQKKGWISRESDPHDRRRSYVGLSRSGETAVAQYLTVAARHVRLSQPVPFMLVEEAGS